MSGNTVENNSEFWLELKWKSNTSNVFSTEFSRDHNSVEPITSSKQNHFQNRWEWQLLDGVILLDIGDCRCEILSKNWMGVDETIRLLLVGSSVTSKLYEFMNTEFKTEVNSVVGTTVTLREVLCWWNVLGR